MTRAHMIVVNTEELKTELNRSVLCHRYTIFILEAVLDVSHKLSNKLSFQSVNFWTTDQP